MRDIERLIGNAWNAGRSRTIKNTRTDGTSVYLHDNKILERQKDGRVLWTLSGWPTVTTRSRLRNIGNVSVYTLEGRSCVDISLSLVPWVLYLLSDEHATAASLLADAQNVPVTMCVTGRKHLTLWEDARWGKSPLLRHTLGSHYATFFVRDNDWYPVDEEVMASRMARYFSVPEHMHVCDDEDDVPTVADCKAA